MLREIGHFLRHAPGVLREQRGRSQAELYEHLMERAEGAGLGAARARLVGDLEGRVLEIGSGTGRTFRHYPAGARVVGVEPDAGFLGLRDGRFPALRGSGTALPFATDSVDHVVIALVLCSVPDPGAVLAEARRVLRPGGTVRLLEHVRSERAVAGLLMDAFDPIWLHLNRQGCHLNRRTEEHISSGGFEIIEREAFQLWSPGLPAFPMLRLSARPR